MPGRSGVVRGTCMLHMLYLKWASRGELYGFLGLDVPEHVDVFGTKFFPMWPGGVSVNWHQDCHYFGTASPKIISCGIYLEDTDEENGCLQVVPGSHTRNFEHCPGNGLHAQGEWATPGCKWQRLIMCLATGVD